MPTVIPDRIKIRNPGPDWPYGTRKRQIGMGVPRLYARAARSRANEPVIVGDARRNGLLLLPAPQAIVTPVWVGLVLLPAAPDPRLRRRPALMDHLKTVWKPGTVLAPVPVVLVSCGRPGEKPNLLTVAWVGTICSEPPMVSISVRPERYSHDVIRDTGEFVINIPGADQAWAVDWCGVVSGRNVDKFAGAKLTPAPARELHVPIVAECSLAMECRIRQVLTPGSHTVFLAEVVAVQAEAALERVGGRFAFEEAGLLSYAHGHYYVLGRQVGHFGYSVRKKAT